jgi:sugar-specific transcriptional regulator TrmB
MITQLGFKHHHAQIYEYLNQNGKSKPAYLAKILGLKRPTVYKALYELEEKNLVKRIVGTKEDDLSFTATHPRNINKLIEKKRAKVNKINKKFQDLYPNYLDAFSQHNKFPISDILSGVQGLKKVHLEVEQLEKEVLLLRSCCDRISDELAKEIDRHVAKRSKLEIPTKIISPTVETLKYTKKNYPKIPNREIRLIDREIFEVSTQIMLYSDKVALTNYGDEVITLLIQQKDIYNSFKILFNLLWEGSYLKSFK